MHKFSSYGPIHTALYFYVSRQALIDEAICCLIGETTKGGLYFTVWSSGRQAARYANQLQLATITVVFFVEAVDDETRAQYEVLYQDLTNGVMVEPVLVTTVE